MKEQKELPLCECGCGKQVRQSRFRFYSPECSQKAARGSAKAPENSFAVDGNTATISKVTPQEVRTLEELIQVCEIDTETWHVKNFECNIWGKGDNQQYQVKAKLERRLLIASVRDELDSLVADAKLSIPSRRAGKRKKPYLSGNMLEISIPDLHVGKMSWAKETGWENYDTKIAVDLFESALEALVDRTASYEFDEVVLVLGNDLLHIDSRRNQTTAGTPQDVDSRYHKVFSQVRQMCTRGIDFLRHEVAPVRAILVPGNHDQDSTWHLGDSLECYFHNAEDVIVDNAPTQRKYHRWGSTMIMWTHGNTGKLPDYPLVMATERPEMWGATKFREAHTGHRHTTKVEEYHGVRVRISPALCAADAWHADSMYVGNVRSAESFVWNHEEGLIGTAQFNVPAPDRSLAAA